jgi:hypothetical protein
MYVSKRPQKWISLLQYKLEGSENEMKDWKIDYIECYTYYGPFLLSARHYFGILYLRVCEFMWW